MDTVTHRTDIVFLGSGAFGVPTLEHLARTHRVRAVVSQPDRPAGRGKKLAPNPVAAFARKHLSEVPLFQPPSVNEPGVREQIRAVPAQAWVVIAFGQKLSQPLLEDRFAINLHASLLPRWRGAAPIHHALLAGDAQTGNSVITLAERMDAGLVLGRSARPIERTQTTGELHDLLAADGPELVEGVLRAHAGGTLDPREQDESAVTLAGKLGRADGVLDLGAGAEACRRRIIAMSPWPGVSITLAGDRLKLLRADAQEDDDDGGAPPGTLIDPAGGRIVTGAGTLVLLDVQPAGKRPMPWSDYARGRDLRGATIEP